MASKRRDDSRQHVRDVIARIGTASSALDAVLKPTARNARKGGRQRAGGRWSTARKLLPDSRLAAAILSAVMDACLRSDDCLRIEAVALSRAQIKERVGDVNDDELDLALQYLIPRRLRARNFGNEPVYFLPRPDRLDIQKNKKKLLAEREKPSS